jgi:hypothetical protein
MALSAADQIRFNTKKQAAAMLRAAARTLTRAAGMAQDALITEEKRDFRAPVTFTTDTRGYRLVPAKPNDTSPKSQFIVLPMQARYLIFTFEQLVRHAGDAGTSHSFVWTPTTDGQKTASGALPRNYTRSLISRKTKGKHVTGGGIFFGKIHGGNTGDAGLWIRPARTKALTFTGLDGKQHLQRPHDSANKVRNAGIPMLLAQAIEHTRHKEIIDFPLIMQTSMAKAASEFGRRLQEEMRA